MAAPRMPQVWASVLALKLAQQVLAQVLALKLGEPGRVAIELATLSGLDNAQVLAALRESDGDLESLLGGLHLYPQKLINVPVVKGFSWQDDTSIQGALAAVEARMSGRGRVLLRASGTEPLLRVMVEGEDVREVLAAAEDLATVVREAAN